MVVRTRSQASLRHTDSATKTSPKEQNNKSSGTRKSSLKRSGSSILNRSQTVSNFRSAVRRHVVTSSKLISVVQVCEEESKGRRRKVRVLQCVAREIGSLRTRGR
jgi:hypothetical protein